jgi:hypothetical protein
MVEYCSIGNVTLLYYVSSVTYGLQTQNDGPRRRTRVMCLGEVSGRSPFFHGPRQNLIGFPCSLLMLTDCRIFKITSLAGNTDKQWLC